MSSTEAETAKLMKAIIAFSPYRNALHEIEMDIVRIAQNNEQISQALIKIEQRRAAKNQTSKPLKRHDLKEDLKLFLNFLEYIYFASPAFLTKVGEWPREGKRG